MSSGLVATYVQPVVTFKAETNIKLDRKHNIVQIVDKLNLHQFDFRYRSQTTTLMLH